MKTIRRPERDIPVIAETQVLVVGSGPAGIAAAVAAARTGAKTMLAEKYGCFGGALSVGQVESYNWYFNDKTYTSCGISSEIEQRMIAMGGTQHDDRGIGNFLNAEIYKIMLDRWVEEEGITPLLHALAVDVVKDGDKVRGVIFESKSGCGAVLADCVIDATGDGDVAALADAQYHIGGTDARDVLPVTMVFGVSGVDVKTFRDYVQAHKEMITPETHGLKKVFLLAQQAGKWPYSREGGAWKTLTPSGDFTSLNITREFGIDGTNVWDLTRADIMGKAEFEDNIGVYTRFIDGEVISHDDSRFQLPYRMIVPVKIDNLLVAGRCAGCEKDAVQTIRMMVCCAATGQAAGTAAALSAIQGIAPRNLSVACLQEKLRADRMILA